jgi:acyl-CoA synthetase (AMP-forming)/AMP-acid ligase II
MCRSDDDFETIASWSGRAIPGVEVRVVGPDGEEVSPEQPGEVVVRGYNVMAGYLDEADETAQVLQSDGWLHTGDVGVMDARGYLRITDRIKDMFIVGGFNAYPAEIERVLRSHPGIADVAVIGVPDPRLGEVGMAWIVPSDEPVLAEELARWSRDRMANFKVPRRVENIGELPRNALGKVRKVDLRARARQVA